MTDFLNITGSITHCSKNITWTNKELIKLIEKKINDFKSKGLCTGDIVVVAHSNLPDFFVELLSLWNLGICVAVLNPHITKSEIINIEKFLSPRLIIDKDKVYSYRINKKIDNNKPYTIDSNALILFTSGTTGSPKAVVHSFRSLISRFALNKVFVGESIFYNSLCLLPFHFGHGLIGNCLSVLFSNGNLFYLENNLANLSKIDEYINKYNITFLSSVPSLWKNILKIRPNPSKLINLKKIHIGSAPLSSNLWEEVVDWSKGKEVVNAYGITETANWIAGASSVNKIQDGLIGNMWGGFISLLNKEKNITLTGEGEIILKTPSLMTKYFKNKELTNEVFYNGWYKTGDIGYIENKEIKIIGRSKSEINRAGLKINPEELDILIEKHHLIDEACAFGAPDEILGEKVCVAVVLKEKENINAEEMKIWLNNKISLEKVPESWFFLKKIPKNDRGKINRKTVLEFCIKR
ncbi:MAG: hypothetical protein CBB97_09570 [Candidatus Endolissoclinum sp. TMED37]|nr:MAG: hypothetical protein CBB97_09570 [Candidatus Endolissoclinum sp. TMED37]|tara:strand:- start:1718 stop:3115 length:1398 start_codon:yes stop_codon:yes gene_type:complete